MPHLTGSEWALGIVVAVIGAVVGYRLSENDRRSLGRTPWGLPSLVWALFWFLSLVLGLVLYLIAHASEVRRAQHGSPAPYPGPGGAPPISSGASARAMTVAEQFPAYPQPANLKPARPDPEPAPTPGSEPEPAAESAREAARGSAPESSSTPPSGPQPAAGGPPLPSDAAGQPPAWASSPPAWHPDPSGRFHFRWWDGHQWTSQVSTDGHHLIDTNPDQRIGPY